MATIASKRKLNTKSIKDKYNALKEVEDGKTEVAAKYGIPKNTLPSWLKNKDKIFEATKKESNSKRQRLRHGTFANLDQAMFKWLLVVRSRDVAVSALVFKTKATEFAEKILNQIYNADEFGLFYRAQPNKSLHLKNENCVGGKHSKLRLAGLTGANAVGEKLPLFVIGKSKKPQCFKHIKHLPCRYRSMKKSWMDSILFEEWVREVDKRFTK